jgi:hypothetical protein
MADSPTEVQHNDPALNAVAVTKSDSTVYAPMLRWFRVGTTAGDVAVRTFRGDTVVIVGVQLGENVRLVCDKILSTGTTAVGITGFY